MAGIKHTPDRGRRRKRATAQNHTTSEQVRDQLQTHIRGLSVAMSAVVVAVAALRRQNADLDEDIACVLERAAADRLDVAIEGLRALAMAD